MATGDDILDNPAYNGQRADFERALYEQYHPPRMRERPIWDRPQRDPQELAERRELAKFEQYFRTFNLRLAPR